ncbi:MAG: type 4a pilus biogenesis protein PilO [Patescibacteria group bacterium]
MKRQLTILIGIGTAAILILLTALFLIGWDIDKRVWQINGLRNNLNSRFSTTENLSDLRDDMEKFKPYIPLVDSFLPNKDRLINLSREFNIVAFQNKVNFSSSFAGESPVSKTDLNWIGLNMNIDGNIDDIINFIKAIENSRYSVKLSSLDIGQKDNQFKSQLSGKVFYFQ